MRLGAALLGLMLAAAGAEAELAISANDGKQLLAGESEGLTPDSISVIDLAASPPRVIGTLAAPGAMIGPPNSVVVSRDEEFAIVSSSQKFDPAHPYTPATDDTLSVIDLRDPVHPKLLQSLTAGAGASGIALNRAGTVAIVASRAADALFIYKVSGNRLTPAGRLPLEKGSDPTDVAFAPDGRHAYVSAWSVGAIIELTVNGTRVSRTGKDVVTGRSTYGAVVTRDGKWLVNTNVGGTGDGKDGTVTVVDLMAHKLVQVLPMGKTTEHVALSPDGRHVALVLANGAATSRLDPAWDKVTGKLIIFAVGDGRLTEVARADTCHWAQGAAWRDDGLTLMQQCAGEREVQFYRFDGTTLVRDPAATLSFPSRPGAIATHLSR